MKIVHDGRQFDFDLDSVEAHELRLVEQHTAMTFPEWAEGLQRGKVDALVAIVFVAKRRAGDDVEWADLDGLNIPELMETMAEANGLDVEAIARGETPVLPAALNRASRRAEGKAATNGSAKPKRAPAKRPAAR